MSQHYGKARMQSPAGAERKPTPAEQRRIEATWPTKPKAPNRIQQTRGRLVDLKQGIDKIRGK